MNESKIKKVSVKFPNFVSKDSVEYEGKRVVLKLPQIQDINNRMYSELFSGDSGMQVGARNLPRIEGFNCTWRNDEKNPQYHDSPIHLSRVERKERCLKIIEKYGGTVIESREDLNQWAFDETNLIWIHSYQVENVNETLG